MERNRRLDVLVREITIFLITFLGRKIDRTGPSAPNTSRVNLLNQFRNSAGLLFRCQFKVDETKQPPWPKPVYQIPILSSGPGSVLSRLDSTFNARDIHTGKRSPTSLFAPRGTVRYIAPCKKRERCLLEGAIVHNTRQDRDLGIQPLDMPSLS
jgi:hypothetical protein